MAVSSNSTALPDGKNLSRFIPHEDMTADQIIQCSYDAMALIALCENTAWDLSERGENAEQAGAISIVLKLATSLMVVVHECLESHEGLSSLERAAD